jgi:hypothetical protein
MATRAVALMAAVMTAAAVTVNTTAAVVAMATAMAAARRHRQWRRDEDNGGNSDGGRGKYNNQLKRGHNWKSNGDENLSVKESGHVSSLRLDLGSSCSLHLHMGIGY